jgi:hypothetical protein
MDKLNLCQYKNILGKPNEGVHRFRIFDMAIFDIILTILLGLLLAKLLKINTLSGIVIAFGLGIIFHKIFCVETTLNKMLKI